MRATNIDDSTHETPRRRLRNRSARNPPSIPRPRLTHSTEEKPSTITRSFGNVIRSDTDPRQIYRLGFPFPQLSRHQQESPLRQLVEAWQPGTIVTSQGSKTCCFARPFLLSYYCKTRREKKRKQYFGLEEGGQRLIQSSAHYMF